MTARRTTTLLASAAIVAGALALVPTTAGGQTAPCEQPYSPVAFVGTPPSTPTDEELPEVPGSNIAIYPAPFPPDTDDDGSVDTLDGGQGDRATITRGSGVVELTATGASSVSVGGVVDIDGGGDELYVSVSGGADEGTYLVPGTVPDGPSAVGDAGILLADGPGSAQLELDGSDRLLVSRSTDAGTPFLDTHDATDVLALGPGGDASTIGPEISREGLLLAFVEMAEPSLGMVIGTLSATDDALDLLLVEVSETPGEEIHLTSAPQDLYPNGSGAFGPLEVILGSEGMFVRLTQSSRSGTGEYLWSLDDPCTALVADTDPPLTTSSLAPASQPVAAEAQLTG